MTAKDDYPESNEFSLKFKEIEFERQFAGSYDKSVRLPLRHGIVISLLSWYSAIGLIFYVIPEKASWLVPLTLIYIGSYFGFLIYSIYNSKFKGYYHILGAISNAWAGLYAVYFCDQFPNGSHLILPVLIFIIFFGSYMVRLRWIAGFIAAASYIIAYQVYLIQYSGLTNDQIALYSFVAWMTLVFALLAGRMAERNNRINYVQRLTIKKQGELILAEKEFLLKEVHHRVKNNLQVILSLINMQLRNVEDRSSEIQLKNIQSRVLSMSTAHQWVRQQSNFSMINLSKFTNGLIENTKSLFAIEESTPQIEIDEAIEIDIEQSIPLGLILNELLLINSNLFGKGELKFELKIRQKEDQVEVIFHDDSPKSHRDFKLSQELIETLGDQLDAMIRHQHDKGNEFNLILKIRK
ncbi:MAG: sensor histidine kinase [Crocinitomicaceae bacterium]